MKAFFLSLKITKLTKKYKCYIAKRKLKRIWIDILGSRNISGKDSFFDLGGNSLTGLQLVNLIRKDMNYSLTIRNIFENPTLGAMTRLICESRKNVELRIKRVEEKALYPTISLQKKEFILFKIREDKNPLNLLLQIKIESLSIEAVRLSFETLVKRHESLRTVFMYSENEIWQKVKKSTVLDIKVIDASIHHNRDKFCSDILRQETRNFFDLEKGPLFRIKILKLGGKLNTLIFCIHHIVSDAQSLEIIRTEFNHIYTRLLSGKDTSIRKSSAQYKDYTNWLSKFLSSEYRELQRNFYLRYLGELQSQKGLAEESTKEKVSYFDQLEDEIRNIINLEHGLIKMLPGTVAFIKRRNGSTYRNVISNDTKKTLKRIALYHSSSLNIILMSYFIFFMYKENKVKDIVLNIPVSTRVSEDFSTTIGWLMGNLIFRYNIEIGSTVSDLIKDVTLKLLDISDYKYYPIEQVVSDLNTPLDRLIKTQLNFLNYKTCLDSEITNDNSFTSASGNPYFDYNFIFKEHSNGIEITCTYRNDIISDDLLTGKIITYLNILNNAEMHLYSKL